ncbi:50S ribosomal protein L23 [Teredinibacter waterburyi]|uniref:50S ribosomal protein L23 n=1 Tax=Teredinibacter waterburyi TaxID=1500538 RepID=UPI00165FAA2F|nr:50S ribosomal protein L23 [Teredinibacter waterburyi]
MNQERLYKVLLSPVVSEKAAAIAELSNQVVFKVVKTATKAEVKAAVEKLFKVDVSGVRVLNVKGKTKRTKHGMGRRSDWKKAYVSLAQGQEIDFEIAE